MSVLSAQKCFLNELVREESGQALGGCGKAEESRTLGLKTSLDAGNGNCQHRSVDTEGTVSALQ